MRNVFKGQVMGMPDNIDEIELESKREGKELTHGYCKGLDSNSMNHMFKKEHSISGYNKVLEMTGQGKRSSMFKNVFGSQKQKKSNNFSNMLSIRKLKKNNTMKNMLSLHTGNKQFNIGNYFKNSNSKNLKPKTPNLKIQNLIGGMQTENIARHRLKQQSKLNPLGDYDGDKLINMLDCNPFDKNKQGAVHTLEETLLGNKQNVQPIEQSKQTDKFILNQYQDTKRDEENKQKVMGRWGEVLKQKLAERFQAKRDRQEFEKSIRLKAREKVLEEIQKEKGEAIYKKVFQHQLRPQRSKVSEIAPIGETIRGTRQALSMVSRDLSAGFGLASSAPSDKIRELVGVQGGLNVQFQSSGVPYAVKVDELVGKGTLRKEWEQQRQPVQSSQMVFGSRTIEPQVAPNIQRQQIQFSTEQQTQPRRIISPYSKKPVSYTRGPYKKHPKQEFREEQY